jgi:eukaryotic-like serine/threonine-protein kinase
MGEVYRARDTRLGRSVAIKLLRSQLAQDARRRERFEREAQAISRLNHPRICTLYDVGHHDGHEFLVMELVDGETLAQRLTRGPLPLALAVRHAIEIAEALDHAHRRGITHRDLKPANIMLTPSGAKLLDFGVAKLRDPVRDATETLERGLVLVQADRRRETPSAAQTVAAALSEHGEIVGTFEYMAPEQLDGRGADERTDVFAFGAVLYEMLTGRRAFEAPTVAAVIGAVLMADPPSLRDQRPDVPDMLERLVAQCLVKDPDDRWQSIRDLLVPLRWIQQGVPPAELTDQVSLRRWRSSLAAALAVTAAALGVLLWGATNAPDTFVEGLRWQEAPPAEGTFAAPLVPSVALSPDGREIVFRVQSGSTTQLYARRLGEAALRALPGTDDAHTPFFAPDGQWIGFLTGKGISKVSRGGAVVEVAEAGSLSPGSPGATWGPDDTIVFAAGVSGLMQVPAAGGRPSVLTQPDQERGEVTHMYPQFLPGGAELLFTVRTDQDGWRLAILTMATGEWEWLDQLGEVAGARYVLPGYILYSQGGRLFAVPFDLVRRAFTGPAMELPESVYTHAVADAFVAQFSASDTGRLAFMSGHPPEWTLVSVDAQTGDVTRAIASDPRVYRYPRFDPHGREVVVSIEERRSDIYIVDAFRDLLRPLTRTGSNTHPSWAPDGRRISFSSRRPGSMGFDLYRISVDEPAEVESLLNREGNQFLTSWAPGGETFAFYEIGNETARDIWIGSVVDGTPEALVRTPSNERGAVFSANGRMIAYVSDESGSDQIWVRPYPGRGPPLQVSESGGGEPVWSPAANRLFYRDGRQLWAAEIEPGPPPRVIARRALFDDLFVRAPVLAGRANYDVSPDERAFVMVRNVDRSATQVHVVENWMALPGQPRHAGAR